MFYWLLGVLAVGSLLLRHILERVRRRRRMRVGLPEALDLMGPCTERIRPGCVPPSLVALRDTGASSNDPINSCSHAGSWPGNLPMKRPSKLGSA